MFFKIIEIILPLLTSIKGRKIGFISLIILSICTYMGLDKDTTSFIMSYDYSIIENYILFFLNRYSLLLEFLFSIILLYMIYVFIKREVKAYTKDKIEILKNEKEIIILEKDINKIRKEKK